MEFYTKQVSYRKFVVNYSLMRRTEVSCLKNSSSFEINYDWNNLNE